MHGVSDLREKTAACVYESPVEARLDRPVVTSNQATLWYCLRACGLDDDVPSLGRLFQLRLPAGVAAR